MKKIYSLIAAVLTAGAMNAQLTMANHAPAPGDNYEMYQCDSTGINPGPAGANAVWTFSAISTHSSVVYSYSTTANSNSSYPNASVVVSSSTNDISYYDATSSYLKYHGGNIHVQTVKAALNYTSPAVYAGYPMVLNTPTNSNVGGSINVTAPTSANGSFTGKASSMADGTGTMVLPGATGTFTDVTRVVTSQTLDFVVGGIFTGTVTQMVYNYFMNGIKAPIFSINSSTAIVMGQSYTQVIVTRNKNAVGISSTPTNTGTTTGLTESEAGKVNVYPNPSSSAVTFDLPGTGVKHVKIFDVTGKLVGNLETAEGKVSFDVSSLNKGLYIYSITSANNTVGKTGKFTVAH